MRHHIVITGTGRSGTSFLVQLLTRLGLDTGYSENELDQNLDPVGRAGLESNIRDENAPYVVKSPNISNYIDEVLADQNVCLDLVVIPIRDIEEAANSRVKVSKDNLKRKGLVAQVFGSKRGHAGGMIKTSNPNKQQLILLKSLSHLLVECAKHDQPTLILHYPRLINDSEYLFNKLKPYLGDIDSESFSVAFTKTVKPEWVSSKP